MQPASNTESDMSTDLDAANKVDNLPIAFGGMFVITARLVDHPEPIVAVVHIGIAHEQVACGSFGFTEACRRTMLFPDLLHR
jgi:hypothetical protein